MKFKKHARKKLCLIFPGEREKAEFDFLRSYILDAFPPLNWNHGLSRNEVKEYCRRCSFLGVEILGLEIYPDSQFPLYVFAQEDYVKEQYGWNWIEKPLSELEASNIDAFIVPVVHVPSSVLETYLD